MIWAILLMAAGLLIFGVSFVLRKKLESAWMISLLVSGVLVAACGGFFTAQQIQGILSRQESIYLGLSYLKQDQLDSAAFYFHKAGSADRYEAAVARYLLEQMRGNDLNARLNLDAARSMAHSQKESGLLAILETADAADANYITLVTAQLEDILWLSQSRKNTLDQYALIESGQLQSVEAAQSAGLNVDDMDRLSISMMLRNGSYEAAVERAANLVDRSPNEENRLLLAEAVAESAYNNVLLSELDFMTDQTGEPDSSAQKERDRLDAQRAKAEERLAFISLGEGEGLAEEKVELIEEIRELQKRSEKLYVYRAFNAIADIHSLQADLMRARLYFSLQDSEQAVETLLSTARSLDARITTDRSLANSLQVVENVYKNETEFFDNQEFRDAMTQLFSAPFPDLMYISQSQLTQDLVQQVINDQKTYGRGLMISGIDASAFPTITVTLAGREDVLQEVVERSTVVSRDTHQEVAYTAHMESGSYVDVCVLLDRSGSMDGGPIDDLKTALINFIGGLGPETSVSLVAFDNTAERLTDLTKDPALLQQKVDALAADGGTNITSGIQEGLEVLNHAGGSRVMLLMTDGQSDVDFSIVDRAAEAGIVIHTIGFGDVNSVLLEEIASHTQGQYIHADSSTELNGIYASLQQIMGNLVTLEYTVESTEITENRYFYIKTNEYSVRMEYTLPLPETDPYISYLSPSLIDAGQLQRMRENGNTLSLSLEGTGLADVQAVTVDSMTANITAQENDAMNIELSPELGSGWHTVTLCLQNGKEISFDQLLLVGEVRYFRNLRLGNLLIPYAQGVLPGDGTLVLGGSLSFAENTGAQSTLDLNMQGGTLILPWNIPEQEDGAVPDSDLDLGDSGFILGWGSVVLGYNDGAYDPGSPYSVAQGAFSFVCGPEQSQMKREEAAA